MKRYIVNPNTQEVHVSDGSCPVLPSVVNPTFLGFFADCHGAVQAARDMGYGRANGCGHCSKPCHRRSR